MRGELPRGWAIVPLKQIAEINPRHQKGLDDATPVTFVTMAGVSASKPEFQVTEERPLGKVRKGFTHFAEGDVLFAKITPCMENGKGAVARGLRNKLGCGTTELHVIRPLANISSEYIYRFLAQTRIRQVAKENFTGTAGQARVPTSFIEELEIPLAPLGEQGRIMAKLESVLVKLESSQKRFEKISVILKRFRQSVLAAACSGRLTADWRGDSTICPAASPITIGIPEQNESLSVWERRLLTDVAKLESGHTPRKTISGYWKDGNVPWISLQDIRAAHGKVVCETKLMPTILGVENSSARLLPTGTVVFCRDISVGYVAIMGQEMATSQHFANWICGPKLNNRYLMYSFMASRDSLIASGQGSTVGTIYMPALKEMRLLLPPIEEQQEIVRRVESLFSLSDRIEARFQKAQAQIQRLTPSILAKAFRGELVPQDPSDEPASVLLEKIKSKK